MPYIVGIWTIIASLIVHTGNILQRLAQFSNPLDKGLVLAQKGGALIVQALENILW